MMENFSLKLHINSLELVKIIYRKAQNGVALKTIFEELKIA